jgi:hypothetical protein
MMAANAELRNMNNLLLINLIPIFLTISYLKYKGEIKNTSVITDSLRSKAPTFYSQNTYRRPGA